MSQVVVVSGRLRLESPQQRTRIWTMRCPCLCRHIVHGCDRLSALRRRFGIAVDSRGACSAPCARMTHERDRKLTARPAKLSRATNDQ